MGIWKVGVSFFHFFRCLCECLGGGLGMVLRHHSTLAWSRGSQVNEAFYVEWHTLEVVSRKLSWHGLRTIKQYAMTDIRHERLRLLKGGYVEVILRKLPLVHSIPFSLSPLLNCAAIRFDGAGVYMQFEEGCNFWRRLCWIVVVYHAAPDVSCFISPSDPVRP